MAAAAAALSKCSFLPTITCMKPNPKRKPINPLLFPNSYQPISFSITNPRLGISHTEAILPKRSRRLFVVSGLVDGNSETCPEVESNDLNECAGCERYHKLVDNLGLVVEYDLREEISAESNADQV